MVVVCGPEAQNLKSARPDRHNEGDMKNFQIFLKISKNFEKFRKFRTKIKNFEKFQEFQKFRKMGLRGVFRPQTTNFFAIREGHSSSEN